MCLSAGLQQTECMALAMWNARFAGQELAMCLRSGATEHMIAGEAKDIAAELSDQAWHRLSAEHGTKGERL